MIRSFKERALQTLLYELTGVLALVPFYAFYFESDAGESLAVLVTLTVVFMLWTAVHNTVFDWVEWHYKRRVASDRPSSMRIVHSISLELSSIVVSVPLILILTDLSFLQAVMVDLLLTVAYVIYGYVFHVVYDYFRPVKTLELSVI